MQIIWSPLCLVIFFNNNAIFFVPAIRIQRAWRSFLDQRRLRTIDENIGNHGNITESGKQTDWFTGKRSNPFDTSENISNSCKPVNIDNENINDDTLCIVNPLATLHNDIAVDNHTISRLTHHCTVNPLTTLPDNSVVDHSQAKISSATLKKINPLTTHTDDSEADIGQVNIANLEITDNLSPRQQRKLSLLSQAKEFAKLKKLDSKALPFNLHMHLDQNTGDKSNLLINENFSDNCNLLINENFESMSSDIMSPTATLQDSGIDRKQCWVNDSQNQETCSETPSGATGFNIRGDNSHMDLSTKGSNPVNCDNKLAESQNSSCDSAMKNISCDKTVRNKTSNLLMGGNSHSVVKTKGSNSNSEEEEDAFDVYNIETALPDMDWNSLEEKLKAASEEAKKIQEARRNDREEIRKKLAMGAEDDGIDDDDDDDETTYTKPNLQSRLHSGLQICFVNESPGDTDNEGMSPRQQEFHDNAKLLKKVSNLVDSDNNLSTVTDLNNPSPTTTSLTQCCSPPRLKVEEKPEDFHSRQEQLQNEAKLALAQAGTMAHMQLEIEKQTKKKSPMAEMVGIPGLGDRHRKKLSIRQLQQMNLASIQVLYNDLQTQIENLNEELVHLLMERDELHMEQDSMLVDIEDLTRRAEELAERANRTGGNKSNKTSNGKGKLPAR
ncbi:AMME chromosomal region protein 1-like [Mactra antiquata]